MTHIFPGSKPTCKCITPAYNKVTIKRPICTGTHNCDILLLISFSKLQIEKLISKKCHFDNRTIVISAPELNTVTFFV